MNLEKLKRTKKLSPAEVKLVGKVGTCCIENSITLLLSHKQRVFVPGDEKDPGSCGFFDDNTRTLAVALDNNDWIRTLIHEYCHLQQYLDKTIWFDDTLNDRFWDWLEGKIDLSEQEAREQAIIYIECERDCEDRTIGIIRKNRDLKIDTRRYIRAANAYIMFYGALIQTRKWYDKQAPSQVGRLTNMMPAMRFINNQEALDPPTKYMKILQEECYE